MKRASIVLLGLFLFTSIFTHAQNRVLELDGRGSYVALQDDLFSEFTEATVEGWVKWRTFSPWSRFFDFGGRERGMAVNNVETGPGIQFGVWSPSGRIHPIHIDNLLQTDQWCHLAAVSGPTGMKLYFNGELMASNEFSGSFAATGKGNKYFLGWSAWDEGTTVPGLHGEMDEIRVWSTSRTQEQIRQNMFAHLTGREDGLAALWNFDDGTAKDASPNARHGRLVGNARVVVAALPSAADLARATVIFGKLSDEEGRAIASTPVRIDQNERTVLSTATDLEGRFRMALLPNGQPYELGAVAGTKNAWEFQLRLPPAGQIEKNLVLKTTALEGRSMAMDDSPLPAVVVHAIRYGVDPGELAGKPAVSTGSAPSNVLRPGLLGEYYDLGHSMIGFQSMIGLAPNLRRVDSTINFSITDTFATTGFSEYFCARWSGKLRIDTPGWYIFYLSSDDGSRLFLNGKRVVDNGGFHETQEVSGTTDLQVGDHELLVDFIQGWGGANCVLSWSGPGFSKRPVPAEALFHEYVPGVDRPELIQQKLAGAPVSTNTVASNQNGEYAFFGLKPGWYQLKADVLGGAVYYHDPGNMFLVESGHAIRSLDFNLMPFRKGMWQELGILDGLTGQHVTCVLQARDGSLWAGTTHGVSRYDGSQFESFTKEDGLAGNHILSIHEDPDGVLWLGTSQGLSRYDPRARGRGQIPFQSFTAKNGLRRGAIGCIYRDQAGVLWFGDEGWLVRYDGKDFVYFDADHGLTGRYWNNSIVESEPGVLLIGYDESPVFRFDGARFRALGGSEGFPPFANTLYRDSSGVMWFGSYRGLYRSRDSNLNTYTMADGLPHDTVGKIHVDAHRVAWVVTPAGLSRFDGTNFVNYTPADGLADRWIHDLKGGSDGSLWLATSSGVMRYDPHTFQHWTTADGLPAPQARQSLRAADGALWWSTAGAAGGMGLVRFHPGKSRLDPGFLQWHWHDAGLTRAHVRSMARAPDGEIWVATDVGLKRFDGRTFVSFATENGLPDNDVRDIAFAPDGAAWLATWNRGLVRYAAAAPTGSQFTMFGKNEGFPDTEVLSVHCASDGVVWAGTSGSGLVRYDPNATRPDDRFRVFTTEDGLAANGIRVVKADSRGTIWVATENGVSAFQNSQFVTFSTIQQRLANNDVRNIYCDSKGVLWFGTGAGATRFDGATWSSLDQRDGLLGIDVHTICEDESGAMWFGTSKGITRFKPQTGQNPNPPLLTVTTDRSYKQLSTIPPVTPGTRVTFEFNAVDLKTRTATRRYRFGVFEGPQTLDRADLQLNRLTSEATDRFEWQSAQPGTYTFAVQYIDRDLNYSRPTLATLVVVPPPLSTAAVTARVVGVVVAVLTPFGIFFGRRYYARRREAERLRRQLLEEERKAREAAEREKLAAERARAAADEANQAKSHFLASMSHELRTPLNAIIGYSEMAQEELHDLGVKEVVPDLQKINAAAKHQLGLVNDILDLSKIEAGKMTLYIEELDLPKLVNEVAATVQPLVAKNANRLEVDCANDMGIMRTDQTKLRQMLFNLLSNACKFTNGGAIRLSVSREGSNQLSVISNQLEKQNSCSLNTDHCSLITFRISDTGIGMTPEQLSRLFQAFTQADASTHAKYGGTGLGLVLCKRFAEMMGGDISVQSEPSKGTTFTVRLPEHRAAPS